MIDTDKYEGHAPAPWVVIDGELYQRGANGDYHLNLHYEPLAQLIADAPLLLEEVKKLREMVMLLDARLGTIHNHILDMEDWEQAQASILAECRGEVPHEIHPYPPLNMKNNR